MNRSKMEGQPTKGKRRLLTGLPAMILVLSVLVCAGVMMWYVAPLGQNMKPGDIASRDMVAPFDIVDTEGTQRLKEAARAVVADVYVPDQAITAECSEKAASFFDSLGRLQVDAERMRGQMIEASPRKSVLREYETGVLTSDEWREVLGYQGMERLHKPIENYASTNSICSILAMPEGEYREWLREFSTAYDQLLRKGIPENQIKTVRADFLKQAQAFTPVYLDDLIRNFADQLIQPTMVYDESATQGSVDEALRRITTQYIMAGEPIVEKGHSLTQTQYEWLKETGSILPAEQIALRWGAVALFYGVLGFFVVRMLLYNFQHIKATRRHYFLFFILIMMTLGFSFFMQEWNVGFSMGFFCVLLMTQLFNPVIAILAMFLLSPVLSVMTGGVGVFDYAMVAQALLVNMMIALSGVEMTRCSKRRSSLMVAGIGAGLCGSIIYILVGIMRSQSYSTILRASFWTLMGAAGGAILGLGVLPVFESVFDIATPTRLLELSDPKSKLLQRLMREAPGTYHHSMMVATLAETCASAIEANIQLLRVGAYYHDIGKLERPYYFSENQSGENPHDDLDPWMSVSIIRAHVIDGVNLLKKEKFPAAVINLVQQYHGTRIIGAFYAKAVKESGNPELPDDDFRYDGPIPQTKESAILMIVDSVEAAVRAMNIQEEDKISELYDKIVLGAYQDRQLEDTPLTFEELEKMRQCILYVYQGERHQRVQYPDVEELKKELHDKEQLSPKSY